jgi:hypothetical protein
MRLLIILAGLTVAIGLSAVASPTASVAAAPECSGPNCPPPSGGGGHDCEHKRQDQTTS